MYIVHKINFKTNFLLGVNLAFKTSIMVNNTKFVNICPHLYNEGK